jgi:hypothetical protein
MPAGETLDRTKGRTDADLTMADTFGVTPSLVWRPAFARGPSANLLPRVSPAQAVVMDARIILGGRYQRTRAAAQSDSPSGISTSLLELVPSRHA